MKAAIYYVRAFVGKQLLSFAFVTLAGSFCSCSQVVTLPVRTVIDLTNPSVHVETDSTINLADDPESTDQYSP